MCAFHVPGQESVRGVRNDGSGRLHVSRFIVGVVCFRPFFGIMFMSGFINRHCTLSALTALLIRRGLLHTYHLALTPPPTLLHMHHLALAHPPTRHLPLTRNGKGACGHFLPAVHPRAHSRRAGTRAQAPSSQPRQGARRPCHPHHPRRPH